MRYFCGIVVGLFFLLPHFSKAQSGKDVLLLDLSDRWLRYDKAYRNYVPYLKDKDPKQDALYSWVDVTEYQDAVLVFQSEPGLMLLTDDRLIYRNNSDSVYWVRIPVHEWVHKGREVKLSIYQRHGRFRQQSFYLGKKPENIPLHKSGLDYLSRITDDIASPRLLHLLFVLFLFAVLRNVFPKLQHELILIQSPLRSANVSEAANYSPFGLPLLTGVLAISSALVQFFFYVHGYEDTLEGYGMGWLNGAGIAGMVLADFMLLGVFLVGKYMFVFLVSWLFNSVAEPRVHYYEVVRVLFKFSLIGLPIVTLLYFSIGLPGWINAHFFFLILILTGIWLSIRLFFTLGKEAAFQNIYLFSYICAAEILPLVLMGKMLL